MPPTKTARKPRNAPKKAAKRTTIRPASRQLSATHKKALAEGRSMSSTVNSYLAAINTPKRRGRKVSKATLEQRLAQARTQAKTASGVNKLVAAQQVRDLQSRLAQANAASTLDVKELEAAFIKIAKKFGENRNIRYGAWRDAGVSADVLRRAGIARTRG